MSGWLIVPIYMAGIVLFVSTIGLSEGMTKPLPTMAAIAGLLMATFGWGKIIHNKLMPLSVMGVFDSVSWPSPQLLSERCSTATR